MSEEREPHGSDSKSSSDTDTDSEQTRSSSGCGPGTGRNEEGKQRSEEERERVRNARGRRRAHGRRRHRHEQRKERILHTRITEQLSEDIRSMAEDLRLPVSNLVRNVLEEAFSVVEQVSDDLGGVLDDVMEGAEEASERYDRYRRGRRERRSEARAREDREEAFDVDARFSDSDEPGEEQPPSEPESAADPFEGVVAWQPVVLHAAQHCARTGTRMAAGERAYAAIGSHGLTGLYVREDALPKD